MQWLGNTPGAPAPVQMPSASGAAPVPGGATVRNESPSAPSANSQYYAGGTLDPNLTKQVFGWLSSQVGQGVPAFDWSSILSSSGKATAPGQLSAPQNQLLQSLMQAIQSPNNPLNKIANTGNPTDVGPAWEAMKSAEQQNIQKNQAQLKEGMNLSGNLAGSPMGTAMSDYETQVTKDQNAQLTQAEQAAQEAAAGRQLTAGATQEQIQAGLSQYIQGLDQASIDRLYQEFQRISPQNNPLIGSQMKAATTMPQYLEKKQGTGLQQILGALGCGIGNMDFTGSSSIGENAINFLGGLGG